MQPGSREAKVPDSPWFLRMKQIQDTLDGARAECGCMQCEGSPYGDEPLARRPCDYAIEIAANLMALYEIQQQKGEVDG